MKLLKSIFLVILLQLLSFSVFAQAPTQLTMSRQFLSVEKWGTPLSPAVFAKASTVYAHICIGGLAPKSDGKYNLTADMIVVKPDGSLYYAHPNLINEASVDKSIFEGEVLPLMMHIRMEETDPDGDYLFIITTHDLVSGKKGYASIKYTYKK